MVVLKYHSPRKFEFLGCPREDEESKSSQRLRQADVSILLDSTSQANNSTPATRPATTPTHTRSNDRRPQLQLRVRRTEQPRDLLALLHDTLLSLGAEGNVTWWLQNGGAPKRFAGRVSEAGCRTGQFRARLGDEGWSDRAECGAPNSTPSSAPTLDSRSAFILLKHLSAP